MRYVFSIVLQLPRFFKTWNSPFGVEVIVLKVFEGLCRYIVSWGFFKEGLVVVTQSCSTLL